MQGISTALGGRFSGDNVYGTQRRPRFQSARTSALKTGHRNNNIVTLVMEAVHISETLVYSNETTRRYIPEGSHLHSRRGENLKSHNIQYLRKRKQ
jgi:hypothetical protein